MICQGVVRAAQSTFRILRILRSCRGIFCRFPIRVHVVVQRHLRALVDKRRRVVLGFDKQIPTGRIGFFRTGGSRHRSLVSIFFRHTRRRDSFDGCDDSRDCNVVRLVDTVLTCRSSLIRFGGLIHDCGTAPNGGSGGVGGVRSVVRWRGLGKFI